MAVERMETAKVAVVGFGTIGSGAVKLLLEQPERLARAVGRKVELVQIVDPDLTRPRGVDVPKGMLTDDLRRVLDNREITAVIKLIGGLEPARTVMLKLLESGKNVITANKALLAEHGPELFAKARKAGRSIAFEAAVAGGIPIIAAIGQSLAANRIESIHAILNGTSNFILTRMEEQGTNYASAVAEAQRLGYAEANPAMDVDGTDAAQKLAILAHLAFGARPNWRAIHRVGIDAIEPADIRFANELGYTIKLLAVAELTNQGLELHVSPTLVRRHTPLAGVREAFNAIHVVGDAVGRVFFHGLGAGQMPTASAVIADLIDTLVGRTAITFKTLALWAEDRNAPVPVRDSAEVRGRFYLRLKVEDRPGVLAEISGILGRHNISIASVIQHETDEPAGGVVPLVIMTHAAPEGALDAALGAMGRLPCVRPGTVRLRVRD